MFHEILNVQKILIDWLNKVLLFSTEIWADQLKKPPCMSRIMRMIMVDKKVAWAEATVILLAAIFGVVRIVTAIPRVRKILVNA